MAGYQQLKGGKEITLILKMGFISGSGEKSDFTLPQEDQFVVLSVDF